jgi:hypothetical protein
MHALNLTPAAPVPTSIATVPPSTAPPGGKPRLLLVLVPALLEVVVPRLATDGAFEPPQPAASRTSTTRATAGNERRVFEASIVSKRSTRL